MKTPPITDCETARDLPPGIDDGRPARPRSLLDEAFGYEVGTLLRVGGTVFWIEAKHESGKVDLVHYKTEQRKSLSLDQLLKLRPGIDIQVLPKPDSPKSMVELLTESDAVRDQIMKLPTAGASPAQLRALVQRVAWVIALKDEGYVSFRPGDLWQQDLKFFARKHDLEGTPTAETLARWAAADLKEGSNLIPRYPSRGGKGQPRVDMRSADMLGAVLAKARDARSDDADKIRLTPTDIQSHLNALIDDKNKPQETEAQSRAPSPIPYLSLSTITRELNRVISPYERDVAKLGKRQADRKHSATARRPVIEFAGGITEFDDLDTKVFCIDRGTGLGWGRPWLTQGVDQRSSFIVGTAMSPKARSAISAATALVDSIEVKDLTPYGAALHGLHWEAFGYPAGTLFDNAVYNNQRIVSLNADVGDPGWARPFSPQDKRVVEYVNGQTVHGFCDRLPGFRGALDDPDALKEGLKTAVIYEDELRTLHLKWMLGDYSNRPMKDGFAPRQKYLELGGIQFRSRVPPDTRKLRMLRMLQFPELLKWGRNGIKIMGLTYQSVDKYKKWIRRDGGSMRVEASIDPDDLSVLYITVPDSQIVLAIPCLEEDYVRGLTLFQQKLILKMCYQRKLSNPSLHDMYFHREELRKLTVELARSGKVRERRASVRTGDVPGAPAASAKELKPTAVHDLQNSYEQLDAVEMNRSEEGWTLPVMEPA